MTIAYPGLCSRRAGGAARRRCRWARRGAGPCPTRCGGSRRRRSARGAAWRCAAAAPARAQSPGSSARSAAAAPGSLLPSCVRALPDLHRIHAWQEHQYVGLNSEASPARSLVNVPSQVPRCLLQASPVTGRFHTSQRHKPHGFLSEYAECSWAIGLMNQPMLTSLDGHLSIRLGWLARLAALPWLLRRRGLWRRCRSCQSRRLERCRRDSQRRAQVQERPCKPPSSLQLLVICCTVPPQCMDYCIQRAKPQKDRKLPGVS